MTDAQRHALARKILLAYLGRTEIPWDDVPALQALIEDALAALVERPSEPEPVAEPIKPTPAEIAASICPDGLVSFIDGQVRKTLIRHLAAHGLGPIAYRKRYDLPADYPMVCPTYGARRAMIAKAIGLGGSRPNPRRASGEAP